MADYQIIAFPADSDETEVVGIPERDEFWNAGARFYCFP